MKNFFLPSPNPSLLPIMLNASLLRKEFPLYTRFPELIYLDSAATALKPFSVLAAMDEYYQNFSANVGRGLYPIAQEATEKYEAARKTVGDFLHVTNEQSVIFTSGATAGINLVANGLAESLTPGSNIVTTLLEHHSNFLPWKELARRTKQEFRIVSPSHEGVLRTSDFTKVLDQKTRIVAFSLVSNVLGIMNDIPELVSLIRTQSPQALILIDACQAAGHLSLDLARWDIDFLVFSGHKLFGPTGIGVLAGKKRSLDLLGNINTGGRTVIDACSPKTEYRPLPDRLEGGTPNIAGALGLAAAIRFVQEKDIAKIHAHESALLTSLIHTLRHTFGNKVRILGNVGEEKRGGLVSFSFEEVHPHDIAEMLGERGIAVRAGQHCASPLHHHFGINASLRVSVSLYNTEQDIKRLVAALQDIILFFQPS